MILITSTGEFLLYFTVNFFFSLKKKLLQDCFGVVLCCLVFTAGTSNGLEIHKAGYSKSFSLRNLDLT